jgi:hypothetical protein
MTKEYDFPVYATQGGGVARKSGKLFIFVEAPNCPGLDVGDAVPEEWDIVPINDAAKHEGEDVPQSSGQPNTMYEDALNALAEERRKRVLYG